MLPRLVYPNLINVLRLAASHRRSDPGTISRIRESWCR